MIALRPFLPADAAGEGDIGDDPIIGMTMEIDGAVAAYAGIRKVLGHHWAFFRLLDERARRPALIHRTTLAGLDAVERHGVTPVFTFCDDTQPRAEAWLRRRKPLQVWFRRLPLPAHPRPHGPQNQTWACFHEHHLAPRER